jgi:hypothetical protein
VLLLNNEAPRHEDVWGSEWLDRCVLDLGTKIKVSSQFEAPEVLLLAVQWIGGCVGPTAGPDDVENIPDSTDTETPNPRSSSQ